MIRPLLSFAPMIPVALGLAACGPAQPPPTTQVILQQPAAAQMTASPTAPPPAQAELVPPPPVSAVPMTWQPGHWRYTGRAGDQWSWQPGQYVIMPPGAHAWVPGQWQAQNGGFVWQEGHWG